jgi:hypothetical protein
VISHLQDNVNTGGFAPEKKELYDAVIKCFKATANMQTAAFKMTKEGGGLPEDAQIIGTLRQNAQKQMREIKDPKIREEAVGMVTEFLKDQFAVRDSKGNPIQQGALFTEKSKEQAVKGLKEVAKPDVAAIAPKPEPAVDLGPKPESARTAHGPHSARVLAAQGGASASVGRGAS